MPGRARRARRLPGCRDYARSDASALRSESAKSDAGGRVGCSTVLRGRQCRRQSGCASPSGLPRVAGSWRLGDIARWSRAANAARRRCQTLARPTLVCHGWAKLAGVDGNIFGFVGRSTYRRTSNGVFDDRYSQSVSATPRRRRIDYRDRRIGRCRGSQIAGIYRRFRRHRYQIAHFVDSASQTYSPSATHCVDSSNDHNYDDMDQSIRVAPAAIRYGGRLRREAHRDTDAVMPDGMTRSIRAYAPRRLSLKSSRNLGLPRSLISGVVHADRQCRSTRTTTTMGPPAHPLPIGGRRAGRLQLRAACSDLRRIKRQQRRGII